MGSTHTVVFMIGWLGTLGRGRVRVGSVEWSVYHFLYGVVLEKSRRWGLKESGITNSPRELSLVLS